MPSQGKHTPGESIDIDRCLRAMRDIGVTGSPEGPVRMGAIEDAIRMIAEDGSAALLTQYVGVKQYAAFGDQREDHRYGYGPRHGEIMFRIGRTNPGLPAAAVRAAEHNATLPTLGADHIYLLECVRDFGSWQEKEWRFTRHVTVTRNLCDTLRLWREARVRAEELAEKLDAARVEAHILAARATGQEAPHA